MGAIRRAFGPLFQNEQLFMVTVSTVLIMMGQGVISPLLPLFKDKFAVSSAEIALTLTSFGLARLVLNVPMGLAADRYGRRALLVVGPFVAAVGMFGSGFSGDIVTLVAWRFVAGAGSAIYATGAQIYLADISTPQTRATFLGTNQSALLLGTSIGPAIGGFAAEAWGLAAPFVMVGFASLIASVYAWWRLPETREVARATAERERAERFAAGTGPATAPRFAWLQLLTSRSFLLVSIINLSIFATRTGGRQTIMPLLGAQIGIPIAALGGIFTMMALVNMLLVVPASALADRYGRRWTIVPSGILVGLSLFWMAGATTYTAFFLAAFVHAVSSSISASAPVAYAVDIAPPGMRGITLGMFRSAGDVGVMAGPPILGLVADNGTFGQALIVNGVFMIVASLTFLLAREARTHRPAAASATTDPADATPATR